MRDAGTAKLARRLDPVGAARKHGTARPHRVHARIVDPRRNLAAVPERLRRVDEPLASPDDHGVAAAQALDRAVVDRPHALGYRLDLHEDGIYARVAYRLLRLAVDLAVVA